MSRRPAAGAAIAALLLTYILAQPLGAGLPQPPQGSGPQTAGRARIFPLVIGASLALDAPPAAPAAYDGTQAYIPLRTGYLEAVSLGTSQKIWSVNIATTSRPAAGDGLVFLAAGEAVQALHPSNGSVRWAVPIGEPAPGGVHWQPGRVIAGNAKGDLFVIHAADGRKEWQQSFGRALNGRPVIEGDHLFAPLDDGRVVALDLATGDRLWERKLPGPPGELLAAGDRLYAGSTDNKFYCLNLSDGRVRWRWPTGGDIVGQPAIDRERVYFLSRDNLLRALDRRTGVQRWKTPLPNRPSYGPLRYCDLFLATGIAPILQAFRVADGLAYGSQDLGVDANLVGPPFIQEGLIEIDVVFFVLTGDGELLGLRPAAARAPLMPPVPPGVAPAAFRPQS